MNSTGSSNNLNQLKHKLFKMIIIDYHLPEMNGIEVIEKLKEAYQFSNIEMPKSVMLTGIEDMRLKCHCEG